MKYRMKIVLFAFLFIGFGCNASSFEGGSLASPGEITDQVKNQSVETPEKFVSVAFLDETQGWAVSSHTLWKTFDTGLSWKRVFTFKDEEAGVIRISPNLTKVTSLTQDRVLILSSLKGLMEFTENTNKISVIFPSEKGLVRGFAFLDEKQGWVVGQGNPKRGGHWDAIAYKTLDGGRSWSQVSTGLPENCDCSYFDVLPVDERNVVFVGDSIAETRDGGRTTRLVESGSGLEKKLFGRPLSINSNSNQLMWIVSSEGNKFIVTFDGGKSWKSRSLPEAEPVFDIAFIDKHNVIALTPKKILESNDSGFNWKERRVIDTNPVSIYHIPKTGKYYLVGNAFERIYP